MKMSTKDIIAKKLLDAQENVRDYESYTDNIENKEVCNVFGKFAEESAMQAKKLQDLLDNYNSK